MRKEFERKIEECGKDLFLRDRACEWLMESSERVVKDIREKS
jgi:hypothetical protein